MAAHVVVVGGGIAGLTAAFDLQKQASVTLIEAASQAGGKLTSTSSRGFRLEGGADTFFLNRPEIRRLLGELDLDPELEEAPLEPLLSLRHGRFEPFPSSLAPLLPPPLVAACLAPTLASEHKVGLLLDYLRPEPAPHSHERLEDPLLTSLLESQTVAVRRQILPRLLDLQAWHEEYQQTPPARRPRRVRLKQGAAQLVKRATARFKGRLLLGQPVQKLAPSQAGWSIELPNERLEADAVVLALPAPQAARLLPVGCELAGRLEQIPYVGLVSLSLGFRASQIGLRLDGGGFLVQAPLRPHLAACTWSHRDAPEGHVLLRVFLRTANTRGGVLGGERSLRLALADLAPLMSLRGAPLLRRVDRWPLAHAVDGALSPPMPPGLSLCQSSLGVPSAVAAGYGASQRVVSKM